MNNQPIAVFSHYLRQLRQLLNKCADHCEDETFLEARLTADMFNLYTQVQITAGFSLRACCPMAGREVPDLSCHGIDNNQQPLAQLDRQLVQTLDYLTELDDKVYDLMTGQITDKAGPVAVNLPTNEFIFQFALPNFMFHLSMVYAIAKTLGIPVTKGDFDGFHQYPVGFSFE
ncbi:DUF1993 family protein [Shewanella maritima]|nr:DUF1993 family protein [Shewanella maritima]